MPRRLRLLWVTPNLPIRGISAARERWWHLVATLAPRHELTLLAFVDPEDTGRLADAPPGLARLEAIPKAFWRPDDPLAVLPQAVAGGFSSPALGTAIAASLDRQPFDVVQYEFGEMAHLMPPASPPAVLTMHQLGFAQQAARWRAERGGPQRSAILLHRYLRDLDFELRAVSRADLVVTMSNEDALRLRAFVPDLAFAVSPCGVDVEHFRPDTVPPASPVDLLFVGNFIHPPNEDAVRFLVRDVLPRLARPARLRVVGHAMPEALERLVRAAGGEVVGSVPDVRPHLASARIVVAPVRFGTGMRGKVLEALAMARPVVTTALGAEGLAARDGDDLLVANSATDVARAIERLRADDALAARVAASGRVLVTSRFRWDTIAEAHDAIYTRVLSEPRRAHPPRPIAPATLTAIAHHLGYVPGVGLGTALLLLRAVGWHARRLRPSGASPPRTTRPAAA
jgi:glycosyltransferase involved in cell wall biosynthesis